MRRQPLKHNHSSGPGQAGGRDPIALLLSKVPLFLESELLPLASCATGRGLSTLPAFEHGIHTTIKRMRLLLSSSLPAYHLEPGSSGLVWLGNGENFLALIPVAALLEVMSFLDRHRGRHSLACACSAFQLPQPALHAARSMVSYASLQAPTEGPCVGLLGRWALCGGKHGCRDHSGGGGCDSQKGPASGELTRVTAAPLPPGLENHATFSASHDYPLRAPSKRSISNRKKLPGSFLPFSASTRLEIPPLQFPPTFCSLRDFTITCWL